MSDQILIKKEARKDEMPEEGAPKQCAYQGRINPSIVRTYEEDLAYIHRVSPWRFNIDVGFVPEVIYTVRHISLGLIPYIATR